MFSERRRKNDNENNDDYDENNNDYDENNDQKKGARKMMMNCPQVWEGKGGPVSKGNKREDG